MRDMFMAPRNVLGAKAAVLSVLAGDLFGKTPIKPSIAVFKILYYVGSIFNLKRTVGAWQLRKQHIRPVAEASDLAR